MDFEQEIKHILKKYVGEKEITLAKPKHSSMGDYAFPCFILGKNPHEEAEKLKEKVELPSFIAKVEVAGPYLNVFLNEHIVAETVLTDIYKKQNTYGQQNLGFGRKMVVEFSSPNIAKPFSVGHLRSTVIGNSLYKVFSVLGYECVRVNHLGDWGTQFGKLMVAYSKWGDEKELKKDPIKYLLKLYVTFHAEAEKDESLIEAGRTSFKKLEDGDAEIRKLWELFKQLSLQEFQKIYDILDVRFDSYNGEAFYSPHLDETIKKIQEKIKTEMSDGALIINLEKFKMPPILLRKSNGSTSYHTRDFAAAFYRLQKYKPEKILYVVGSEQKLHFNQLFTSLELCGYSLDKFVHVDFGLIRFPEGKMSTRKGRVIFLEDLLQKAITMIGKIIDEKNPHLQNKEKVAQEVGVGAIIFADLSNDRNRNIDFDWERMLSFEGETGPYIQYTHARACSIVRKAHKEHNVEPSIHVSFAVLNLEEEQVLLKQLYAYPEVLRTVARTYKPHHLAQYLIQLSQQFNEFYHKCPVLSDVATQMKARVLLVDCVRQVLANGLDVMGIKSPKEM